MESTGYHYIVIRDGVPRIKDSRVKVVQIAEDFVKAGWDGQEIHENYPWLSLPQIYSALAYYFEHKEEIDAEIERRDRFDAEMRARFQDDAFLARAREMRRQLDEAKAAQTSGRRKRAQTPSAVKP